MKYIDERSKCLQDPLLQPKLSFGSIKSKKNIFPYYSIDIIQHSKKQIPQTFRFGNNKSWDFPMKNMRYMLINSSLQKLSSKTIAAFTTSTRTDIKMQTYVKIWEHLWHVAHSSAIIGKIIAIIKFLERFIVRTKCVPWNHAHREGLSNSRQKQLSVCSEHVYVSGAQCSPWTVNKFVFVVKCPKDFRIWSDTKTNSRY